jgi:hypothetical protein
MLKKIHSNRNPKDTLYSEVRNEFGAYFTLAGNSLQRCLHCYPRLFYGLMTVLLLASLVLSFTVFRQPDKLKSPALKAMSPVRDGFDKIMLTSERLRETIALKRVIDSIATKNKLTAKDSVVLDSALDRLREINKPSKRKQYEN